MFSRAFWNRTDYFSELNFVHSTFLEVMQKDVEVVIIEDKINIWDPCLVNKRHIYKVVVVFCSCSILGYKNDFLSLMNTKL